MTTEPHHGVTIPPGAGRSPSSRRRFAIVGMAASSAPLRTRCARLLPLGLAVVLMGACSRHNTPNIDPALKAWIDQSFTPAMTDMATAAHNGSDLKAGCQAANDALTTQTPKLLRTPDAQLTQLVQAFIDERHDAYTKCVETGVDPTSSAKLVEVQKRVNELNAKGRAG
jgi:hypothetical protein